MLAQALANQNEAVSSRGLTVSLSVTRLWGLFEKSGWLLWLSRHLKGLSEMQSYQLEYKWFTILTTGAIILEHSSYMATMTKYVGRV